MAPPDVLPARAHSRALRARASRGGHSAGRVNGQPASAARNVLGMPNDTILHRFSVRLFFMSSRSWGPDCYRSDRRGHSLRWHRQRLGVCCAMGTNAGQLCSSPQACGYTCPEYHAKPPLPDGCYNFKTGNGQVEGNGFPTNYGNEAPASTTIIDLGDGGKTAKVFVMFWQGGAASKDPQDPYTTCSVRYTAAITYEQAPPLSEQGYVGGNHSADGECGTVLVWTADKSTLKKSGDLDLCSSFEPPVWDDPHGDDDAGFPWKPYGNKTYAATGYVAVWFGNERGDGPLHVDGPFFESTSDCSGSNLLCEGHIFSTTCFLGQPNGWLFPMLIVGILLAVLYWVFKCRKACKAALAQVRHTASRSCPRSRSPPSLLATPPIRRRLAPSLPPSLPSSLSPLDSPTAREPSSAPGAATRRPSLRQAATRRRLRLQPTHRPARNGRVPSSAAASRAGRRTQPHVRSTAYIGAACRRRHLDNTDINSSNLFDACHEAS